MKTFVKIQTFPEYGMFILMRNDFFFKWENETNNKNVALVCIF